MTKDQAQFGRKIQTYATIYKRHSYEGEWNPNKRPSKGYYAKTLFDAPKIGYITGIRYRPIEWDIGWKNHGYGDNGSSRVVYPVKFNHIIKFRNRLGSKEQEAFIEDCELVY
jgi:hypothetical protein